MVLHDVSTQTVQFKVHIILSYKDVSIVYSFIGNDKNRSS